MFQLTCEGTYDLVDPDHNYDRWLWPWIANTTDYVFVVAYLLVVWPLFLTIAATMLGASATVCIVWWVSTFCGGAVMTSHDRLIEFRKVTSHGPR